MQTRQIAAAYDQMAEVYLGERGRLKSSKYVQKLLKYLPKDSLILDLGCGAGVPVDEALMRAGHRVIGVDISPKMIETARRQCPGGEYSVRDVLSISPGEYRVQAVVSLYAMFHVPRTRHREMMGRIASWIVPKGMFLISMGEVEFEGGHNMHGVRVWSSQWGAGKNRELVERAGFEIMLEEIDTSGGERHQVILAQKKC